MKICIDYDLTPQTAYYTYTKPTLGKNIAVDKSENVCNRVVDSMTSKENEHAQRKGLFKEQFSLLLHIGAF